MTEQATKLAVALKYQAPRAPLVTAVGRGEMARRIVELAESHDVPVSQNDGLALALSKVEIDEEIPENLYRAVAEVLAYILRVSGKLR
jgi:flagellar biosynthesis protein